ncbi:MAG: hypothetical protein U0840_13390 [Gemmataceae bacterium]
MATVAECQSSTKGVSLAVIELNDVQHVFATAGPQAGFTLREQLWNVLTSLDRALQPLDAAESLLHLTVFLVDGGQMSACRQMIRDFYGENTPATSFVPQTPCTGGLVAVEVLALGRGHERIKIEHVNDQLLIAREDGVSWIFADQAMPRTSAPGVYEKTICAYQHLQRLLPKAGARLDQVLRTWLYLGGIVEEEGATQRYKELNRARADVYDHVEFMADRLPEGEPASHYPASTGIGTNGRGLCVSALALVSDRDEVVAVPLENPRQTPAFDYAASYSPQSPKFSRGLAAVVGNYTTLFISGTASITHSETRHIGDPVGQTHETLENIAALISEQNLANHGLPGKGTTLQGIGVARVYIKRQEDYPAIRAVCDQRLPGVPLNYLIADVCRPDLLVEIEGIAFTRHDEQPTAAHLPLVRRCHGHCGGHAEQFPTSLTVCPTGCPQRLACPYAVLPPAAEG